MKVIKFYKNGCAPCKSVEQYLDSNGIQYEDVNIYDDPDTAFDHGIMSVPVVILLNDDGTEANRAIGFNIDKLKEIVAAL